MSDSVWPHRWQPTRLPRPWDSPGKNPGVGCHFLLQCMKVKSENEVPQSCPTLSDPMDWSLPGSSVHGIFPGKSTGMGCHCLLRSCLQLTWNISEKIFRYRYIITNTYIFIQGFPGDSVVKNPLANAGGGSLIPGSGISPGEGNGNSLQYSCLENPMDRGVRRAIVGGVAEESDMTRQLNKNNIYIHSHIHGVLWVQREWVQATVIKRNLGWGIWEFFVLILSIWESSEIISKLNTENGKRSGRKKQREKMEDEEERRGGRWGERLTFSEDLYQSPLSLSCSITLVM